MRNSTRTGDSLIGLTHYQKYFPLDSGGHSDIIMTTKSHHRSDHAETDEV